MRTGFRRNDFTRSPDDNFSTVKTIGFYSERYTKLVKELLKDRQDTLEVNPVGVSKKKIKERIDKYYTQEFSGETAMTQVVAAK